MTQDTERSFPRQVVISPGFGAGLLTWGDKSDMAYGMIEHPALVKACLDGASWEEARSAMVACGYTEEDVEGCLCSLGWEDVEVVAVSGPYLINEYDGSESIEELDRTRWRQ